MGVDAENGSVRKIEPKELTSLTKAKDLSRAVFEITENAPKKYRFTLVSRMQNISLDIISLINHANEVFVDIKLLNDLDRSIKSLTGQKEFGSEAEKYHVQNKLLTLKLTRATTFENRISKRIDLQHEALSKLKELDHLTTMSAENKAILSKQRERLVGLLWETRKLVGAWIKSDRGRYNY